MEDPSMNHYEQQLYSVFKSFDVNNEESLDETAVNNLCDALQLEERGAALVDTLFEKREGRVSFAQFRSGLLAVLADGGAPPAEPPAPRLLFGTKEYGRRSRAPAAGEGAAPRAASASRLEEDERRPPQRPRFRRSASVAARPDSEPTLDHDRRIDRDEALALCRSLRMHSIDRRLVERIFDDSPTPETTVGEFFDRLNRSLGGAMEDSEDGSRSRDREEREAECERVIEAWEQAGVCEPRRLLAELGCGAAPSAAAVERALEEELGGAGAGAGAPGEGRAELLAAALALARRRAADAERSRDMHAAERDKLRGDVAEANERARLLASEVDENHARIENELKASLKRSEAKLGEEARRAWSEAARERERADAERARAEGEAARRLEAEARLRAASEAARREADEAEARALAAEERAAALERAGARAAARLREAEAEGARAREAERAAAALAARVAELTRDCQRLRDRGDELSAALEAAPPAPPAAPAPAAPRGDLSAELRSVMLPQHSEDAVSDSPQKPTLRDSQVQTELVERAESERRDLAERPQSVQKSEERGTEGDDVTQDESSPEEENSKLKELVKELEGALEAMRAEYEACEEYWGGKLREERAAHERDAARAAERLADLCARIAAFERRLAPPPPALASVPEAAALEAQVAELEAEWEQYKRESGAREAALAARAARAERRAAREAGAACARCAARAALGARCARAEGAVRRLQARLAAADALVKELYVENCHLAHHRPLTL